MTLNYAAYCQLVGVFRAAIAVGLNGFKRKSNAIDKHLFLRELQDSNEVLFSVSF